MIHPIERRSYEILSEQFDFGAFNSSEEEVVKRVIHATADFDLASSLTFSAGAIERGIAALKTQTAAICDVEMVRAGITRFETICLLNQIPQSNSAIPTRSHKAMSRAAKTYPKGAIFVIGCAPTALDALIEIADQAWFKPALVIGLPVGFVGAAESKLALRNSSLPYVTNSGNKGGSPAAAAAFNAIVRMAEGEDDG